ncbi:hypothetical protein [Mycoplasma seminis]|uniref:Lipoprotein n=1 Tax=Mycoplasma seminis TaxID=512749 RepID=A0ABY9HBW2_9MOLU|nr:hypothetical protein [Mycoplasma seminis]WLP85680.1 hypothetical protein Q8852_00785 [Mycoplasma seminis]
MKFKKLFYTLTPLATVSLLPVAAISCSKHDTSSLAKDELEAYKDSLYVVLDRDVDTKKYASDGYYGPRGRIDNKLRLSLSEFESYQAETRKLLTNFINSNFTTEKIKEIAKMYAELSKVSDDLRKDNNRHDYPYNNDELNRDVPAPSKYEFVLDKMREINHEMHNLPEKQFKIFESEVKKLIPNEEHNN